MGSGGEETIINFENESVVKANVYDCVRKMKDYFIVTTEAFGKAPVEDLLKPVLHWTHRPRLVVRVHSAKHFKVETVMASTPHLLFPNQWLGGEKTVLKKTGLKGVKLIYECSHRADTYTLETALLLAKKLLLYHFPKNPLPLGLCQDSCFIQFQDISSEISSIFGFVVPQINELTFRGTFQFSEDSNQFDAIFASIVKPDVKDEHVSSSPSTPASNDDDFFHFISTPALKLPESAKKGFSPPPLANNDAHQFVFPRDTRAEECYSRAATDYAMCSTPTDERSHHDTDDESLNSNFNENYRKQADSDAAKMIEDAEKEQEQTDSEQEVCESDYSVEVECVNTQMNAVKINDNNFYKEQRSRQASDCEPVSVPNASKFMKSKETGFSASLALSWDKLQALVSTGIDIVSVISQIEANKIDHNNIVNGKMQKQQDKKPEDANGVFRQETPVSCRKSQGFFNQLTRNENMVVSESKMQKDDKRSPIKSDKTLFFERGTPRQPESSLLKQRPSYQKTFVPKKGEKRHGPMLIALNSSSQWNLGDVLAAAILSHAYTPKSNRKNVACGTKIVSASDANGEFDFMVGGPTVYSYEDCYHKFTDEHELTMGLLGRMPVNEAAGVRLGTAGLCWAMDGLWANHILVLKTATELDKDAALDDNEVPPDPIRKIAAQIYFQTYNRLIRPIDELVQGKIDKDSKNLNQEVKLLQRMLSLGMSPSQYPENRREQPAERIARFHVCVHIAAQYLGKYIDTQVRLEMLQGFRYQLQKEMKQVKSPKKSGVSVENGATNSKYREAKVDYIDKWLNSNLSNGKN